MHIFNRFKNDLNQELEELEKLEKEINQKMVSLSNEYLVKAGLTLLDIKSPTRIADAKRYFEQSIELNRNDLNVSQYENFLKRHNLS